MKINFSLLSYILVAATFIFHNQAHSQVQLGEPQVSGTGCPLGRVSAVLSPNQSAISVLFDQFDVLAHKGLNQADSINKKCRFVIPVVVPSGYVLEALSLDYRGFAQFSELGYGTLTTTGPILQGGRFPVRGPSIVSKIGPIVDNFMIRHKVEPGPIFNNCRSVKPIDFTTELKLFNGTRFSSNSFSSEAQMTLDSLDVTGDSGAIDIQIRVRRCQ